MTYIKVTSPVEGTTRYTFVHEGRTGVVAGSTGYWKAAWVSPLRSQPFTAEVSGRSREEAAERLVAL